MMQKMALSTSVNLVGLIGSGVLGLRTKATGDGTKFITHEVSSVI